MKSGKSTKAPPRATDISDNPEMALTFDDMDDAASHYGFIVNNMSILDLETQSICIAEAQTYYKEI